jgi:hypothetical protein
MILLNNHRLDTRRGGEIASRERLIDRNSTHQGGLMYLARTCDAAGGLPGFNYPHLPFGERSRVCEGREVRASLFRRSPPAASRFSVRHINRPVVRFPVDHALTAGELLSGVRIEPAF